MHQSCNQNKNISNVLRAKTNTSGYFITIK